MIGIVVTVSSFAGHLDKRRAIPAFTTDKRAPDSKLSGLKKDQRRLGVIAGQENDLRVRHPNRRQLGAKVGVTAAVG